MIPAVDPFAVARSVTDDLRGLYGARLREVILFGSWARGDADPESDIDLLVVLDEVGSVWEEQKRMDDVLWRHSLANETVVTGFPVAMDESVRASPFLLRARAEGLAVG